MTNFQDGTPLFRKLYEERYEEVDSMSDGLEKILAENYAFVWSTPAMDFLVGDNCKYTKVDGSIYTALLTFISQKGYEYQKLFDYL